MSGIYWETRRINRQKTHKFKIALRFCFFFPAAELNAANTQLQRQLNIMNNFTEAWRKKNIWSFKTVRPRWKRTAAGYDVTCGQLKAKPKLRLRWSPTSSSQSYAAQWMNYFSLAPSSGRSKSTQANKDFHTSCFPAMKIINYSE